MSSRKLKHLFVLLVALAALAALALPSGAQSNEQGGPTGQASGVDASVDATATGKVLILDSTVVGGINSTEAQAAIALGLGVDVVTPATWATLTAPQFASYAALVIGDPSCGSNSAWAAASANAAVWGPVINGNVIAIGTDPVFHQGSNPGAITLINRSMALATGQAGTTGLYATLSCWAPAAGTPVDILNVVEPGFTASEEENCAANIAVVATNPFIAGLTNDDLSGWSCSVHEFFATWPADFVPIALDTDGPQIYTAPDGTAGAPYIVGRAPLLVAGDISLGPVEGTSDVSVAYQMTAFVQYQGTVQVGTTVTLNCTGGPNDGLSTTAVTDESGNAVFTLTATTSGTDTCTATFVNPASVAETSNAATVTWTGAAPVIVITPRFTG